MTDCRLPTADCRALVLTRAFCTSAEQETILLRLAAGDTLAGPAVYPVRPRGTRSALWRFGRGGSAHKPAVEALARRGLIALDPRGDKLHARLIPEALPT